MDQTNIVVNIVIEQGSTWLAELTYTDAEGEPIDLTGAEACMQLRRAAYSEDVVIELDTDNNRIVIEPLAGKLTLTLTADETATIETYNGVYDLELKYAGGMVEKLLRGNFTLVPEVTKCL